MKSLFSLLLGLFLSAGAFAQTGSNEKPPQSDPRNYTTSTIDMSWVQPVVQKDGCRMMDGVLRCYKNNMSMAIDHSMELDNGTLAFMNGALITRKGEIIHLKNGDCVNLFGAPEECEKKK